MSADMYSVAGWLSFRRIVDIPFQACVATLENRQRTGQGGELHIGQSLLREPIELNRDSGTCQTAAGMTRTTITGHLPAVTTCIIRSMR